ncbi:TIGR04104 family putative zinc finger protein [Halobacillus sp. HZG1]|uniref:TIGR04104 family putative zinc finger protein n=1 Tax=Halobacillus sp. HZG1 TaxID=3111769 RepID=UPI003FA368A9
MKLPKCNVCNHQFNWKKVYISLFKSNTIHCEKCGTDLDATNLGRLKVFFVLLPMLLISWIYNIYDYSDFGFLISLLVMILIAFLISLFLPYLVKYESSV